MSRDLQTLARNAGVSKKLTRSENEELYKRLTKGDKAAIKEMIEGNIALVIMRVEDFLLKQPFFEYLRDDLQSEGLLALTIAVTRLSESDTPEESNPVGYLYTAVSNAVSGFANCDPHLITRPCTLRKEIKGDSPIPKSISFENPHAGSYIFACSTMEAPDLFACVDMEEEILAACASDLDRGIVQGLLAGLTPNFIAEQHNQPLQVIYHRRRQIKEALDKRLTEYA